MLANLLQHSIHLPWSRAEPPQEHPSARARALTFSHPLGLSEWRRFGKQLVEVVAQYYEGLLGSRGRTPPPVASRETPGFLRRQLPAAAPEHADSMPAVLHDIKTLVVPGLTHWQSPSFFSYFPCNTSVASMLADMVVSGVGVLGFQWASSPACTELEQVSLEWLAQLLGLPPCFLSSTPGSGSVLQGSASEATLVALLAAKARTMQGRPAQDALKLVAYGSDQTHSCFQKACMVAGIQHVRLIGTGPDDQYALQPEATESAVRADLAAGLIPCFMCATIGTTSSCAVDPVEQLAILCKEHGIWLHVDAAWAGVFSMLPEQRELYFKGLQGADSYDTNPHKGLLTGWECSAMYVQQAHWVQRALKVTPAYLQNAPAAGSNATAGAAASTGTPHASPGADSTACSNGGGPAADGVHAAGAGVDGTSSTVACSSMPVSGPQTGTAGPPCGAGAVPPEYKDLDVPLGHGRFRGLRLWMVLRLYGAERLRQLMLHRLRLTDFFADLVRADSRFELVPGAPPRFGLVCFRLRSPDGSAATADRLSEALVNAVNASGAAMLSHTALSGRYLIRCAMGGTYTQGIHVEAAWHATQRCAEGLLAAEGCTGTEGGFKTADL